MKECVCVGEVCACVCALHGYQELQVVSPTVSFSLPANFNLITELLFSSSLLSIDAHTHMDTHVFFLL